MSDKTVNTFEKVFWWGTTYYFFEVVQKQADGSRLILANSSHYPDFKKYDTSEQAKRGGLEWLKNYLQEQLKEVEEALNDPQK